MINNNHKDSGCGYAEQLIAYLYDESDGAEKAVFEKHLAACPLCTDELESFSGVQFSINDWKLKDFATLETPLIEIPYETKETAEISNEKVSWLAGLRGLFSPSWSLATASFAVLAVVVGIVLFSMNSRQKGDLAESNNSVKQVIAPTVEKSPAPSNVNNGQQTPLEKTVKPENDSKSPQPEVAVKDPNSKNERVVKASTNPRPTPKAENATPKVADTKRSNKNNNDKIPPKINNDDDEEDDSLRLAELFDEIDTK